MTTIDVRDIPGTNCYLDQGAYHRVKDLVCQQPLREIHFLGSGNYHYLSYFFLGRVTSPFYLVLFDNHPDCQAPAFGDILSCGGWVKRALSDYPLLKAAFIVGANPEHVREEEPFPEKVVIVSDLERLPEQLESTIIEPFDSPNFYISIDKDVLSPEYALTDWDQGEMSLLKLCECLSKILSFRGNILGIDICGDSKSEPNGPDHPVNQNSNEYILKALSTFY